jgi:hypothetical protein
MDETAETPAVPLKKFVRHPLNDLDRVRIYKNVNQVSRLATPLQIGFAAKFLIDTKNLIDKVQVLRKERGYEDLGHDADFMEVWKKIEAAAHTNEALTTLSLTMQENMKLSHEINAHLGAMGKPLMKVYQA